MTDLEKKIAEIKTGKYIHTEDLDWLISELKAAIEVIKVYGDKKNWGGDGKYKDVINVGDVAEYHGGMRARRYLEGKR
jgi:hypothetical protein